MKSDNKTEDASRRHTRLYFAVVAVSIILVFLILVPVYPQTIGVRVFVGLSPNCNDTRNCSVTDTGIWFNGYSSVAYALFGLGYSTIPFSTTMLTLPTETNASTGAVSGHTTYKITAEGSLDSLKAVANTTAGPVQYGCVFAIPNVVAGEISGIPYSTFLLSDGTSFRASTC